MESSGTRRDGLIDIFEDAVERPSDRLIVRNPTVDILGRIVRHLHTNDGYAAGVDIVATENVLRELSDQFVLGTLLADLVESGVVSISARHFDGPDQPNLLVSPTSTTALVSVADSWVGLRSDVGEPASVLFDESNELVEDGAAFDVRTPGASRIQETITDALGTDCARDFDGVFRSLRTARDPTDDVDKPAVFLLLAARNRQLFYDLSRWAEEIGIASKATFSRRKTQLESSGLLTAENVHTDVGRPRHRLCLADKQLQHATPEELSTVAVRVS